MPLLATAQAYPACSFACLPTDRPTTRACCVPALQGPLKLTPRNTEDIHLEGGTVLGTSRSKPDLKNIVKW